MKRLPVRMGLPGVFLDRKECGEKLILIKKILIFVSTKLSQ